MNNSITKGGIAGKSDCLVRLGFVPLTDAAPLILAHELALFAARGLNVQLLREASWASIRDKVALDVLDGAQMLAPMPLAAQLGVGGIRQPLLAPMQLSTGGNAITVSLSLFEQLCDIDPEVATNRDRSGQALKKLIDQRRSQALGALKFGMVFPTSSHNYLLRHWLAQAGIDPDRDVQLVVIPPPQMVFNMEADAIAGFCVGEPWNTAAVQAGSGVVLASSRDIWPGHGEKVLGVSERMLATRSDAVVAVMQACAEAADWLSDAAHLAQAARILSRPEYINLPEAAVLPALRHAFAYGPGAGAPSIGIQRFCGARDACPAHDAGVWWLTQMIRWGQLARSDAPSALIKRIYPAALCERAFGTSDSPNAGAHRLLGPVFDADAPMDYLAGLEIGHRPEQQAADSGELTQ